MTWNQYNAICTIVANELGEDPSVAWKSIKCMHTEEVMVLDIQKYYRDNRVYFIGDGTGLTGFIIVDPDPTATDLGRHDRLTFVDLDTVQDITFAFDDDKIMNHTYPGPDTLIGPNTVVG